MGKLSRRQAIAVGASAILGGPAALAKAEEDRTRAEILEAWLKWKARLHPTWGPVYYGGNRSGATNHAAVKAAQEMIYGVNVPIRIVRLSNP